MRKKNRNGTTIGSSESLKQRCARLRSEAEAGNDDASATFFTAMFQALTLRIPDTVKAANLMLLLDRMWPE